MGSSNESAACCAIAPDFELASPTCEIEADPGRPAQRPAQPTVAGELGVHFFVLLVRLRCRRHSLGIGCHHHPGRHLTLPHESCRRPSLVTSCAHVDDVCFNPFLACQFQFSLQHRLVLSTPPTPTSPSPHRTEKASLVGLPHSLHTPASSASATSTVSDHPNCMQPLPIFVESIR